MEMIGRVADCHLEEEDIFLHEKISKVLDEYLSLVGEHR